MPEMGKIRFSEGSVQRFKYWNRKDTNPIRMLYRMIRQGEILDREEAVDILGVTYNPEWTYIRNKAQTLLIALEEAASPPADWYSPCVFPLPLPDQQISKNALWTYRKARGEDSEYADIGEDFQNGSRLEPHEYSEVMGEGFIPDCEDPYLVMTPDKKGVFLASGPVRPRKTKRDFDPRHFFAPYQIITYIHLEPSDD